MARTHLRKRILLPLLVLSLTTGVFLAVQLAEADQDRWDLSPEVQADLLARYPKAVSYTHLDVYKRQMYFRSR